MTYAAAISDVFPRYSLPFSGSVCLRSAPNLWSPLPCFTSRRVKSASNLRNWPRQLGSEFASGFVEEDYEGEEEGDPEYESLELLVKFVQNVFRKTSKRATKAMRAVLPPAISTNLVVFSVNGLLILALLWVLKAFLQVVCTIGSVVYVSILLTRMIWSVLSYLQDSKYRKIDENDDDSRAWVGTQPLG